MSTQFALSSPPTDAISSVKFSPFPRSTRLLVSSWDRNLYLYDLRDENGEVGEGKDKLLTTFQHRAPVLDVCWGRDESECYTACLDWDVRRIDLNTGEQRVISTHEAGVKSVVFDGERGIVISIGWDCMMHVHLVAPSPSPSPSQPPSSSSASLSNPSSMTNATPLRIPLPSKPFSCSISPTKLVVAMSNRSNWIYELTTLATAASKYATNPPPNINRSVEPWQRRESSLKFMTRTVACMPNDDGYATSSIEGRVAVEWFDPSPESQDRKYAFKCHRQPAQDAPGVDVVYPVNALTFHPVFRTFASGGGDGVVALWDGVAKRRIRQYQRYGNSVASLGYSCDGRFLAVGVCEGFEDGKEIVGGNVAVYVRELGETEARGKSQK
ncbi:hypothetical protein KEM54_003337 [Ascosphaera aggregata]|nr:hypothetical protein KEM54_003337 [Ascosphaera aggregata]